MAMRGVNLAQALAFVSENDPDKGNSGETVFTFKRLDGFQGSYLGDLMVGLEQGKKGDTVTRVNMGRVSFEAVALALQEADNFLDAAGLPITITRTAKNILGRTYMVVDDTVMQQIEPSLIQEMYQFLTANNAIQAADAKKSAPQS